MDSESPSRAPWNRLSVLALVLANLVPVYGVLALGWDVFPLVLLFWLENVVIGAFNVLRLLAARPSDGGVWAVKLFLVPFFAVHYGLFTFVHGVFVFVLFSGSGGEATGLTFSLAQPVADAVATWHLGMPLLALTASHLYSFVANYLLGGEYLRTPLQKVMFRPYGRIIALHVAILLGGLFAQVLGSPIWALLILIAVKIGFDVTAHLRAHAQAHEEGVDTSATTASG
jgi:hypothetical protein